MDLTTITAVTSTVSLMHAGASMPTPAATSVATPTPQASVQLRARPTTTVAATTTTQPCVEARSLRNLPPTPHKEVTEVHPEVTEVPEEEDYHKTPIDVVPADHQAGSHVATAPVIASATVLPTALHPISLSNLVADAPPSGTPRTA